MGKLFLASNFYIVSPMVGRILQDKQKGKRVIFITTAAEVEEGDKGWLEDDKNALRQIGLELIDYTLTGKTEIDFKKDFQDIHYVFVSGGNTFYLLQQAQQSGFISFINQYMQNDNVYFGSSAGSAIAGKDIYPLRNLDDEEKAPHIHGYKGFGFVDLVLFPHWGSKNFKDRYLNQRLEHAYTDEHKLMFLTDKQFLYIDESGSYVILAV